MGNGRRFWADLFLVNRCLLLLVAQVERSEDARLSCGGKRDGIATVGGQVGSWMARRRIVSVLLVVALAAGWMAALSLGLPATPPWTGDPVPQPAAAALDGIVSLDDDPSDPAASRLESDFSLSRVDPAAATGRNTRAIAGPRSACPASTSWMRTRSKCACTSRTSSPTGWPSPPTPGVATPVV